MHISDYLIQKAEEITRKPLPNIQTEDDLFKWRKERQKEYHKMLGIDTYLHKPRTPLNMHRTGIIKREEYRVEKIYFESLPNLFVAANLYIPNRINSPVPAIVYLCGHSGTQKVNYQEHGRKFAQLGFITLIIDTVQFGEVKGLHHGTYSHGMYNWISKGYTPAAIEVWNAIRGIDLLTEMEQVDSERIGMTGQSGGGSISWWTGCADDRVKVIASSCGTGTIESHIREETINTHCDCVFPSNPYGRSLIEISALMAPRPVLIVSPDEDKHFQINSVRYVSKRLKAFYERLSKGELLHFFEFEGRHSYSSDSRKEIFHWFIKHLMGNGEQHDDKVTDVDEWREDEQDLLVFNKRTPANDESTTVQDWFIPNRIKEDIQSSEEHQMNKLNLINHLQKESFATFPQESIHLDMNIRQRYYERNLDWVQKFDYQSEKDFRICGELQGNKKNSNTPAPTVMYLRTKDHLNKTTSMLDGLNATYLRARIDPRGTGKSSWGSDIDWYIRRSAALTGRTIASIRVWDTLRGIEVLRSMDSVDSNKIILAGEGEMTIPVLYAALLDTNVSAVILKDPPASQDVPATEHLEIINSLRYTDLPNLAGMLWPTQIIFVGDRPSSYRIAENVHKHLGHPGGIWHVPSLEYWPGI
ncbi:acetylxylan esterase [Pontibacillus sp. HMF3514]|uniref:acetylxylan esterase n=1 Tax=Pontibacillus sp. HMF3514 TaxID=2692425 RepID=UPI00131FE22C|nr:acetylxylan esterase [Pontibacillus sp. HMF3514]QHE53032.1 hypothetical protein GS400_13825 [Pontibacillus sp. HMF3514]